MLGLESKSPVLNESEYLVLDIEVESRLPEDGNHIIHKVAGGDFDKKMVTTVLDANVCQLTKCFVNMRRCAARKLGETTHTQCQ